LLQIWNGIALGSNLFLDTPSLDAADASVGTLGYSSEIVGRIGRSCIASFASSCSIAALFSRRLLPLCTLALLQHCFSPAAYGCTSDMVFSMPCLGRPLEVSAKLGTIAESELSEVDWSWFRATAVKN